MSQTVTASEANQKFSELLRKVQRGDSVTITSRGKPVAKMVPVDQGATGQGTIEELIASFKQYPRRRAGNWKREDLYER